MVQKQTSCIVDTTLNALLQITWQNEREEIW